MNLPILMYHNFCDNSNLKDKLTVSLKDFENQLIYLKSKKYKSYHFNELENLKLSKKSIIITFDDITINQLPAIELVKKYGFKVSLFIPFYYINKFDEWNIGKEKIMSISILNELDNEIVELGYHSFYHRKYSELTLEEIENDFDNCNLIIKEQKLKVSNVLAYPFGNYPKEKSQFAKFQSILKKYNIKYGLRIGNKKNKFPFRNNYEIKRIDIKGNDSLLIFRLKLIFGKIKPF